MTRRTALPSVEDVQLAVKELTEITGKSPTALAPASPFGLANTTFRRNFPDIAADLAHQRATGPASADAAISRFDQLKADNEKLRRDNHELAEHLELAVANIQRLTLESHRLRQQLETANKITRIDPNHWTRRPETKTRHWLCVELAQVLRMSAGPAPIALCGTRVCRGLFVSGLGGGF